MSLSLVCVTKDIRLIGSVTLVALLAVTLVGMEWVTRVQKFLLLLLAAQLDFLVGTFLPPSEGQSFKLDWDWKLISFSRGESQGVCWLEQYGGL